MAPADVVGVVAIGGGFVGLAVSVFAGTSLEIGEEKTKKIANEAIARTASGNNQRAQFPRADFEEARRLWVRRRLTRS